MKIISFPTHYEITPYVVGQCRELEIGLSTWNQSCHRWEPLGYTIIGQTLCLPKGIDPEYLTQTFNSPIFPYGSYDKDVYVSHYHRMLIEPRDNLQKDAIDFIIGRGSYPQTRRQNQVAINLKPGDGKTYCTIYGIVDSNKKAIIISHTSKIRSQWYDEFMKTTDVSESDLVIVDGVDDMKKIIYHDKVGDYYFINHQTIQSAIRNLGYSFVQDFFEALQVGIKVYDEAHIEFASILKLDMLVNVSKTYYLTATFRRTNSRENRIFNEAFASVFKFSNKMSSSGEKRKYVIYCPVEYNSDPSQEEIMSMYNKLGLFSTYNYIDYELEEVHAYEKLYAALEKVFAMIGETPGRILVTNPKIEHCETIRNMIQDICPNKTVGTIHSRNKDAMNINNSYCDIIVSTIKSNGVGVNIESIRFLINLEPFASTVVGEQLKGRLREYSSTDYSYFFDIVDIGVPKASEFLKRRTRYYKKECNKVVHYKL